MRDNLRQFTCNENISFFQALQMIDANKKGFLVVIDERDRVLGTLTDGDVRRAFMGGAAMEERISGFYVRDIRYLRMSDGVTKAVEIFKNEKIKFLPVEGEDGTLLNILTKNQLHALLLLDIRADLGYDFCTLDENIVNYEIFPRPWGFYKTTVMNDHFQSKIISVNPGASLSLQEHRHREEHWIVAHGRGLARIGGSEFEVSCGSTVFIPKGCLHRIKNISDSESLIITEVQIGDYFGEDDIIRYDDEYGRT